MLSSASLILMLLLALPVGAQTPSYGDNFDEAAREWTRQLDAIERELMRSGLAVDRAEDLRSEMELVRAEVLDARAQSEPDARLQRRLFNALGPPPGEGDPPDDETVASERAMLSDAVALHEGRVKRCDVLMQRVDELLARVAKVEAAVIARVLTARTLSPLTQGVLAQGITQLANRFDELARSTSLWWHRLQRIHHGVLSPGRSIVMVIVVVVLGVVVSRRALASFGPDLREEAPEPTRRLVATLVEVFARAAVPALAVVALAMLMSFLDGAPGKALVGIFETAYLVSLKVVAITGLTWAILMPRHPQWRVVPFDDQAAVRLYRSVRLYALTEFGLRVFLVAIEPRYEAGGMISVVDSHPELSVLSGTAALVLFVFATLVVLRPSNWRLRTDEEDGNTSQAGAQLPAALRLTFALARAALLASVAMSAFGYLDLGLYVATTTTWTLLIAGLALMLRLVVAESLAIASTPDSPVATWLSGRIVRDESTVNRLAVWLLLAFDIVITLSSAVLILLLIGIPLGEIQSRAHALVSGIQIGAWTLSLADLGLALIVFLVFSTGVRMAQKLLASRVLQHTKLDAGARDALTTGVGYSGIVIAILLSLSVLGLDFGKLALILGGLSVGIGFGLQHVVNNFVSGLILLIQRPIKSGDWVVVGNHEGYVKRINVLATELETFDNAAVIVPNNTMLSSEVLNWHHKSRLGRVKLQVRASYDTDPNKVRDVLLACADKNEDVLSRPAPYVLLLRFGVSALELELRFYLREIDTMFQVASDMRFAVKEAFDDAGIKIPFPQQDIHVRTEWTAGEDGPTGLASDTGSSWLAAPNRAHVATRR